MENLPVTLEKIQSIVKTNRGAKPTIEVDFKEDRVFIVDACSGFLKHLYNSDESLVAHFHDGKIEIEFFKR